MNVSPYKIVLSIALTVLIVVTATLMYYDVHLLAAYILAANLTTIALYFYDKSISHTRMMRVPENALHTMSVLGGSPGALLAGKLFRHKTQKTGFQMIYWIIVLLQVTILVWIAYNHYFPNNAL